MAWSFCSTSTLRHERIARFQREAQVLASLNHPQIASTLWHGRSAWTPRRRAGAACRPEDKSNRQERWDGACRLDTSARALADFSSKSRLTNGGSYIHDGDPLAQRAFTCRG